MLSWKHIMKVVLNVNSLCSSLFFDGNGVRISEIRWVMIGTLGLGDKKRARYAELRKTIIFGQCRSFLTDSPGQLQWRLNNNLNRERRRKVHSDKMEKNTWKSFGSGVQGRNPISSAPTSSFHLNSSCSLSSFAFLLQSITNQFQTQIIEGLEDCFCIVFFGVPFQLD